MSGGGDLVPRENVGEPTALAFIRTLEEHGLLDDVSFRPADLSVGQALGMGGLFGRFARAVPWWIGDLLVFCQSRWGEGVLGQIEEATGLHPETCADYQRMAETIPLADRVPGLSFRHYRAVKKLDSGERRAWLSRSVEHGWSSDRLRIEVRAERAQPDPEPAHPSMPSQLPVAQPLREIVAEIVALLEGATHGVVHVPVEVVERLRTALALEAE